LTDNLLIIIATGDREKALAGLMYSKNALKRDWLRNVKVVYFGPSEKLIVEDSLLRDKALEVANLGECFACKSISDRDDVSEKIDKMGINVEYVGSIISKFIKEGYAPMVW
jgi:hypothetical protein